MATAIRQLPARLPLSLSAGDDFAFTLTVTENGTPYLWTGATVEAVLVGYTVAAFSADTSTAGTLILSLTDAQTATAGIFGWYLRVTKAGGSRTWCAGTVHVSPATDGGTSSSSATLAITTAGSVALAITVGTAGPAGPAGSGLAAGGTTGQVLAKNSNTDYDTEWITAAGLGDMIAANNLSDLTDASTARTNLGLGTAATTAATAYATAAQGSTADTALQKVAAGASVENLGAVESNVLTVAATGATETLDVSTYGVFDCTMDQACTFTFSDPAPSGKLSSFVLILRGAFTPTLPASVDWGDATPPTYTTPSMYVFTTVDGGTIWFGAQVGKAFG